MRSALVFGSTGLVGGLVVRELLADDAYDRVTIVVRRDAATPHPKRRVVVADFDSIEERRDALAADDVYLCLGTTRATTPDPAAYYRVDHDYPVRAAALARAAGAARCCVVTAVGADLRSRSSYLRAKGELERDLAAIGFARLHCFRPSMLLGTRAERRPLERALIATFRVINPLFVGSLDRFRGVEAVDLARAMVRATRADAAGPAVAVHEWRDIVRLAAPDAR